MNIYIESVSGTPNGTICFNIPGRDSLNKRIAVLSGEQVEIYGHATCTNTPLQELILEFIYCKHFEAGPTRRGISQVSRAGTHRFNPASMARTRHRTHHSTTITPSHDSNPVSRTESNSIGRSIDRSCTLLFRCPCKKKVTIEGVRKKHEQARKKNNESAIHIDILNQSSMSPACSSSPSILLIIL